MDSIVDAVAAGPQRQAGRLAAAVRVERVQLAVERADVDLAVRHRRGGFEDRLETPARPCHKGAHTGWPQPFASNAFSLPSLDVNEVCEPDVDDPIRNGRRVENLSHRRGLPQRGRTERLPAPCRRVSPQDAVAGARGTPCHRRRQARKTSPGRRAAPTKTRSRFATFLRLSTVSNGLNPVWLSSKRNCGQSTGASGPAPRPSPLGSTIAASPPPRRPVRLARSSWRPPRRNSSSYPHAAFRNCRGAASTASVNGCRIAPRCWTRSSSIAMGGRPHGFALPKEEVRQ